jgi:hypothetical protein
LASSGSYLLSSSDAVTAPARGYGWPPFQAGNVAAQTHGSYSPRKVDPLAAEILAQTRQHVTWWRPADEASVWAWARTEARVQLLAEWLTERGGDLDDAGSVRPAADLLTKLEARAESMRSRLGLEPLSRARLGRDVAASSVDLARLWAAETAQEGRDGPGAASPHSTTEAAHPEPAAAGEFYEDGNGGF